MTSRRHVTGMMIFEWQSGPNGPNLRHFAEKNHLNFQRIHRVDVDVHDQIDLKWIQMGHFFPIFRCVRHCVIDPKWQG